ncbi:hypothetical protein Trydic_g18746 [Trypoxylus dichotomus]
MRLVILTYVFSYCIGLETWLEEGELCKKRDGIKGICRHYLNCSSAIEEVFAKGRPEICSFRGIYPIVCCEENGSCVNDEPPVFINRMKNVRTDNTRQYLHFDENSLSLQKCRKFHGEKHKIHYFVGGRNSLAKEFPHMALLGYGDPNDIQWLCGGSLISEEFVLTAAHCLNTKLGQLKYIRLGELDLVSTTDDAEPQNFSIKQTYLYPYYTRSEKYHDIALVQLHQPAKLTDYVKPACLAVSSDLNNSLPQAMGWGLTSKDGKPANILQSGYLRFVSNEACRKTYGTSFEYKEGILDKFHICADGGGAGRDTCQGDSGGPLQITNYNYEFNIFPEIIGITSFGKDCGLVPSVYTKVLPYVLWIEGIVWPN